MSAQRSGWRDLRLRDFRALHRNVRVVSARGRPTTGARRYGAKRRRCRYSVRSAAPKTAASTSSLISIAEALDLARAASRFRLVRQHAGTFRLQSPAERFDRRERRRKALDLSARLCQVSLEIGPRRARVARAHLRQRRARHERQRGRHESREQRRHVDAGATHARKSDSGRRRQPWGAGCGSVGACADRDVPHAARPRGRTCASPPVAHAPPELRHHVSAGTAGRRCPRRRSPGWSAGDLRCEGRGRVAQWRASRGACCVRDGGRSRCRSRSRARRRTCSRR